MKKLLAEALVGAELRFGLVSKAIEAKEAIQEKTEILREKAAIALVGEENTFNKDKYIVVPKTLTVGQVQELSLVIGTNKKITEAIYDQFIKSVGQSFE